MKKLGMVTILVVSGLLYAGSIKDKYMSTIDKIDKYTASEEEKSRILDENINRALKMTLLNQYNLCNYEKAQINKDSYEVSDLNQNLVYIQYGDFVGYYLFETDPRRFLQAPQEYKIVLPPGTKIIRSYEKECTANTSPIQKSENKNNG